MTVIELRNYLSRFTVCQTISDCYDLLDIFIEFFFKTMKEHNKLENISDADRDAEIVAQMMMTKAIHLKSAILNGITYQAKDGSCLNKIIDPTIIASSIRSVYETTSLFNLIYRYTKTVEEKTIIHLLWEISGLNYRQEFENVITKIENRKKFENEKREIENKVSFIESTDLYKKLTPKNQDNIQRMIKYKKFLMEFEDLNVKSLNWYTLTRTMGVKQNLFKHIYSLLSLNSHPSNVSVFQFREMFSQENGSYLKMTISNLNIASSMFSIFISDYIYLFPSALKIFNSLDICDQIVINAINILARNKGYSINDSTKYLEG